jgi:epoxyqueuosine reductase
MFPKSNVKRTGRERFIRNVLIAIGNSGDVTLVPDAERLLDDPSPLIRGAAVWALSQLLPREDFVAMRREDTDAGVQEEWETSVYWS